MTKAITFLGMPGAGKSTVGKLLAEELGYDFVDLDILIKEKTGRSHVQILEELGEAELLRLEEEYTLGLDFKSSPRGLIFSPGGSIIYSPKAMAKIKNESLIIYLELSLAVLKKRLDNNISRRGIVGLKEKGFNQLYAERTPIYSSLAHRKIDCMGMGQRQIVKEIIVLSQLFL